VRVAAAVAAVATVGLGACGYDGPTDDDRLAAAHLAHPAAVEIEHTFSREEHVTTIHGVRYDLPARSRTRYRLTEPVSDQDLVEWYETRLSDDGWSRGTDHSGPQREVGIRRAGSNCHRYAVTPKGDTYEVTYTFETPDRCP
jgi:hypothetical protein